MPFPPDLHEGRVDLHRVDALRASAEGDGDVVAGARPDDEHVVVGAGVGVGVEVEGRVLGDLPDRRRGLQRGVVDVDANVAAGRRLGADLVVGRPLVGADERLEAQHDHRRRDPGRGQPAPRLDPRSQEHEEHRGGEHRPGERRHPEERQAGEGDDAEQRAADVEAVGLQRREEREGAGHLLGDGAERGDGEQEDDGERQPPRQWLESEGSDQRPSAGVRRARAHGEEQHEGDEAREQDWREREHVTAPGAPEEAKADAEEAGEQDEVREVDEVEVVGRRPPDERQLHEQHERARQQQPGPGRQRHPRNPRGEPTEPALSQQAARDRLSRPLRRRALGASGQGGTHRGQPPYGTVRISRLWPLGSSQYSPRPPSLWLTTFSSRWNGSAQ